MVKLFTEVELAHSECTIALEDRIMLLGSCFADRIADKMRNAGFNLCANPFGTLYNPASILNSLRRLESAQPFCLDDCVEMGAGAGLICSFSHHSSFARKEEDVFLENANASLLEASKFWKSCNKLIITLGTSFVWSHNGQIVSNCLKRNASEFEHRMLSVQECNECLAEIYKIAEGRDIIITVSPIRHLSQGAHNNTLSKARLQLACEMLCNEAHTTYFPSYEIVLDQLRDYRFYDADLLHPSQSAVDIIWEKFLNHFTPNSQRESIRLNEKESRRKAHREMH